MAGRSHRLEKLLLLGPGLLYLTVLFLVPTVLIVGTSFFESARFGGLRWEFGLDDFERALDPLYLRVLGTSLAIAGITTLLALLIGYPAAWAIARLPGRWRLVVLLLVVLPFWTNFLVRTYAWIVLLNSEGPVNGLLMDLGLIGQPLSLLYTPGAVVAGLLYAYLPLMILPLFVAIDRLDPELREAARDLGASPARTFLTVTLPMTLPGALTGCIFVFVPSLGNFVIPELLGGGKTIMVGNLIRDQFLETRNWPFGSVLALSVLGLLVVLLAAQSLLARRYAPVAHA
jgi:spermidine/putrescine transport system permease protein